LIAFLRLIPQRLLLHSGLWRLRQSCSQP
jgi:hypothetical protein